MNSKNVKIVGVALLVYLVLAFAIPKLLNLTGSSYWLLAGGLALIGLLAAAAYLWLEHRNAAAQKAAEASPAGAGRPATEPVQLLQEAEDRLRSSRLGKGARFATLPAAFVIGPQGSTKTTAVMQSGLDPELLAGQVYQEGNTIAPTRFVNVWFARQWIFLEPGAAMADAAQWSKLIRKMRPGPGAGRKGAQAPRVAVVCFDCEELLKTGAPDSTAAAARELREKLTEISQTLGINLPVYVLFTKADRIPFFHDYFQTLTNEETAQPLGATLPAGIATGAYDQEQTSRLNAAAERLYLSLAGHRIDFLARQGDAALLPGAYEFPREFRKIRNLLVQFLLDLCRPSQLSAAPFLRGFYFSGVRPILVRDAAPAPVVAKPREGRTGATGVFRIPNPTSPLAAEGSSVRRVPQWIFLRQFFSHVLLSDEAALGASAVTAKTSTLKRALLASAAAVGLFFATAWTVSFFNNHKLEQSASDAAAALRAGSGGGAADTIPSLDDLTRLDALRRQAQTIGGYNRDGAPLRYRWGLYVGQDLYPSVRRLYFQRFFKVLFASTQAGLLSNLQSLPAAPAASDSYQYPYDSLKSYLITTSNHDKSTQAYLSPVLYSRWETGKSVDSARAQLARTQFDFYSQELAFENPFSSTNDPVAIQRARRYLAQFAGTERVYRGMLAAANQKSPALNFNRQFSGSAVTVVNNRDVEGAFTKTGWTTMQDAIKNPDRYFNGEQWVLGDQSANIGDRAKLQDDLRKLYDDDYTNAWREYLKRSAVVSYTGIPDAAKKLKDTSGAQSPLLAMFCMASQNVDVDPEIAKSFKALLTVVPSKCGDQYIGPTNQDYMKALVALQIPLGQISTPAPDGSDPNVVQAKTLATAARVTTAQLAQGFGVDPLASKVQTLIEDPITQAERVLKGVDSMVLNQAGKMFCGVLRPLLIKYPFNPQGTSDASLDDVNGIFRPKEGALWKFYDQTLQKVLQKQGTAYAQASDSKVALQPGFVASFNRLAAFSNALYGGGADPHFTYSLRPIPSEGTDSVTLNIDGQSVSYSGGNSMPKSLNWPGMPAGVRATIGKNPEVSWATPGGLWGAFRFFRSAQKPAGPGASSTVEWVLMGADGQPQHLPNGNPLTVRSGLEMGALPPVFATNYFSSLSCVADVAK